MWLPAHSPTAAAGIPNRRALPPFAPPALPQGLWRGTVPGQLLTVPYTAVQFVTLQQCRQLARQWGLADSPRWQSAVPFVSGALAGAAATIASYPFDLLRTTLAAQGEPPVYATMTDAGAGGRAPGAPRCQRAWRCRQPRRPALQLQPLGLHGCLPSAAAVALHPPLHQRTAPRPRPPPHGCPTARGIVRQSGVAGLYRGLGVTVLEIMPYAALQFGLYDLFNNAANTARVRRTGSRGRASGCGHAVVESRGSLGCCPRPWRAGRRHGCRPGRPTSHSPPLCALAPRRGAQARLDPKRGGEPPSSAQAFWCGLAAGMLAKLGTHPLDVAKKRFQVAGLQRSARYGQVRTLGVL